MLDDLEKWQRERDKRHADCVKRFVDGGLKLCREAPSGPWEWVAEDSSMLMLTKGGDEMMGCLMWANRCSSCAKTADTETDPEKQHLCGWPTPGVSKFIANSRSIVPAALIALLQAYNGLKDVQDMADKTPAEIVAKARTYIGMVDGTISRYWDHVRA